MNDDDMHGTDKPVAPIAALDCLPFAKKFVAKRMMLGVNG